MTESRFKPRYITFGVIALTVIAAAVWLTIKATSTSGGGAGGTAPTTDADAPPADPGREALAKLPERLRARPDVVTGQVRLAAEKGPGDPAGIVNAIHDAVKAGRFRLRDVESDAPGAPRPADELAAALLGKDVPGEVGTLELTALAGALFEARDLGKPQYGRAPGARFDATALVARRYVVRADQGAWLATDGESVDQSAVVPFDEVAMMANVLAWRALGAMVAGDDDLASTAANQARRLAPDDPAIAFVVGKTQINAGLVEMGVATMERVAKDHADALTWQVLGRMERIQEKPFRADQDFRKAIAADPAYVPPHLQLAELALERLDVTPQAEHEGILAQAEAELDAARKIDPKAPGIRVIGAHIAALREDTDKAIALLKEETELNPTSEDGWLILAQVYAVNERDTDAIAALRGAVAAGVESADIEKALGLLLASSGAFDEAYPHVKKALALNPRDNEIRPQLAQLERARSHADEALRLMEEQVEQFPDDALGSLLLAQLELDAKNYDIALKRLDKLVKEQPDNKDAVMLRYLGMLMAGRADQGSLDAAVAAVGSRRQVAEILLEQGRVVDAEALLKDALESEPEDALVPVYLVGIYVGTGRDAEAQALREATLAPLSADDKADVEALFNTATEQAMAQRRAHEQPPGDPAPPSPDADAGTAAPAAPDAAP